MQSSNCRSHAAVWHLEEHQTKSQLKGASVTSTREINRGTKRLVSVNICSVEGNSAGIFDSRVSPGIFVVKEKRMPIILGRMKLPFWVR